MGRACALVVSAGANADRLGRVPPIVACKMAGQSTPAGSPRLRPVRSGSRGWACRRHASIPHVSAASLVARAHERHTLARKPWCGYIFGSDKRHQTPFSTLSVIARICPESQRKQCLAWNARYGVARIRPDSVGTRAHEKAHNAPMASIRPKGDRYRAFVKIDGKRATKVFDTRRAALAWAQEQEAQLSGDKLPDKTFGDACKRYSEEVTESKRGGRWDRIRIARFLRDDPITKRRLQALTSTDLAEWRDTRLKQLKPATSKRPATTIKPATVAREMNLIAAILEIARREWRWLKESPMRDVQQPKKPKGRARRISSEEVEALARAFGVWDSLAIETPRNRIGLAFLFALETAMRSGEICELRWSDVHMAERYVTVRTSKNGDSRDVPLTLRAIEILKALPLGFGPVFGLSASKRDGLFRKVRDEVKSIKDLHFHDSRAEAIWRLSKKLDVLELARVIGHRNLSSLLIYYRASAAELAKRLG